MKGIFSILTTLAMLLTSSVCVAQRYQRSFEVFGFPDGELMGDSLKIAIPLLLIGLFFVFVIAKGNKGSKTKDTLGCIGWIILLIGVFFLIPIVNMGGRYRGINLEHFTRHRNCYRHYRSYKRETEA